MRVYCIFNKWLHNFTIPVYTRFSNTIVQKKKKKRARRESCVFAQNTFNFSSRFKCFLVYYMTTIILNIILQERKLRFKSIFNLYASFLLWIFYIFYVFSLHSADGHYEVTLMTKATVYNTGLVIWQPPAVYKSSCSIDVEYFPYDVQTCVLKLGSWTYDGFKVHYLLPYT